MPRSSHPRASARRERIAIAAFQCGIVLSLLSWVTTSAAGAMPAPLAALQAPLRAPSFVDVVEAGSTFIKLVQMASFVFGAYQLWANRKERLAADASNDVQQKKDANYQAWQVVNSAQGKGGSGGRIDALADLARNRVSLAGVNLDQAWLEGVDLRSAVLTQASFREANLQAAVLDGAHLDRSDMRGANMTAAQLARASLRNADLSGARLSAAVLDGADLNGLQGWQEIRTMSHASIRALLNPPPGFVEWALANGADDPRGETAIDHSEYSREFRAL